jgi:ACS family glucarate transporter-like MFS transporter
MGVVQAPLFPVACGGAIESWFPVSGWAFPNGLTNTGLTLGAAATAPLIAWLMQTLGWVPALATGSVFAMIGVGLWFFIRADKPMTFHSP